MRTQIVKLPKTLVTIAILLLMGCGPVVWTASIQNPPPPWFYPNRLEVVRYVYFPEYSIYYDLSTRVYIYLDGGVWVRRPFLPSRYRTLDLRRSRYERVRGYRSDNIKRYHEEHNANRGRSNREKIRRNN
ncbi:hypothetical protein GTQ34_05420 [Muricauda sp. JGD-17]|uniref:Lipoprotein n=1 Tax=Flagellimonas ochracea TaxID=2696472 RepID=A0A964TC81_9FLAO|nr:hypothetical protein [Allomuricauda ochracea]NAY91353.1 hypothetical protein [Allomuricauda ochracea]